MRLSDFDFKLPSEFISVRPVVPRGDAKLLVCSGTHIQDTKVSNICSFLRPGDRLILNDTKVIPARLSGSRARQSAQGLVQARVEVTLLEALSSGEWNTLVKPLRKLAIGDTVVFSVGLSATCTNKIDGLATLAFSVKGEALTAALDVSGQMPLPPYIASKRAADEQDKTDYQTIWARQPGAVAAPTASLHLDATALASFVAFGVDISFVTLHVGAGTFLPVKVEDISNHKMHAEWGHVSAKTVAEIEATTAKGGRIIPVGTTALRLIETAAKTGTLKEFKGNTDIFIYPGFNFRVTDGLMTNFHLPKSTLLMLVAALISKKQLDKVYLHAIANEYRFFSYGDASLLFP